MSIHLVARRIVGGILVLAAVAVWLLMAPDDNAPSFGNARGTIESDDDRNNGLADGAPQQAVVNGWSANKYLELISKQLEEARNHDAEVADPRLPALALLGVLGLAVVLITSERSTTPAGPPPPLSQHNGPAPH